MSARTKSTRYVIALASLASYRTHTVRILAERLGEELTIYSGVPPYDPAIRTMVPTLRLHHEVRNRYFAGDILFQNLPWLRFLRAPVVLLDLNPRIPHVWLLLLARNVLGKPTVLWGHAWPRGGRNTASERVRHVMRKLATSVVTYTVTQADELRERHPTMPIFAAPNAMYSASQYEFDACSKRHSITYVGRLHPDKKPNLLLDAFEKHAVESLETNLEIVGDGPELGLLRRRVRESPVPNRIHLHGQVDDYESLRKIYARSIISVSPGYAGLSITQSLGFGVPILISRNENHAPEIEAAVEGWNSLYFRTDNSSDLADRLTAVTQGRGALASGRDIVENCAKQYSAEAMAQGLIDALENSGSY